MLDIYATALLMMLFSNAGYEAAAVFEILFGIAGIVPTFIVYKHFWLKLLCAIIGTSSMSIAYMAMDSNGKI